MCVAITNIGFFSYPRVVANIQYAIDASSARVRREVYNYEFATIFVGVRKYNPKVATRCKGKSVSKMDRFHNRSPGAEQIL